MSTRLAYFGPPGTNAEEAALVYIGEDTDSFELVPISTITGIARAVQSGGADAGIVPIENSLEGSIPETLDLLIHSEKPLFIHAEVVRPINFYLLAKPGVKPEDIKAIRSIPIAVAQCRSFIEKTYPDARIEAALSTAAAVEDVMKRDDAAAIANKRAGDLYGAVALAELIQDRSPNHTRFVIMAPEDHAPTGDDRTSVAFGFESEDRPGQLVSALNEFSTRRINLTKIESRPSKERLGTYIFLADVVGHRAQEPLKEALEVIEKSCSFFRVLGSYPRYRPSE
ncbi:MAG: prephenate dehydratase [Chloroflexota bacterium]